MPLLIMKLIHVAAVVVFLGTIVLGIYWKALGDRTRDPKIIAHTLEGIIGADRRLTMPSATLLFIFGFGAQGMGHYPIMLPWILWSIILFVISTIAFMGFVSPTQKRMLALARSGNLDWKQYDALSAKWRLWGTIALVTPIIAFVLMIVKPQ